MTGARRRREQAGFTLIELLLVIVILGIISAVLAQSVILGFRTTDVTANRSGRAAGAQAAASYFTDDVQSAERVATSDGSCAGGPVFLHLTWTLGGTSRAVSYSLEPAGAEEQDLVRWSCAGSGPPTSKVLGHFARDAGTGPGALVSAECDGGPCPGAPSSGPSTVTLRIEGDHPVSVTVRRRTAP